jgi:hypothetical protein
MFCEYNQKGPPLGYPKQHLAIACVAGPLNQAITKKLTEKPVHELFISSL